MFTYELLEQDCYYVIQLEEKDPLALIQVKVITDNCMYVVSYHDSAVLQWVKKSDPIFDIVECLSDSAAQQWLNVYNSSENEYYEGDED